MNAQPVAPERIVLIFGGLFAGFWLLVVGLCLALLFRPWLRAFLSGAPVSLISILGMRLRGTPPGLVIDALVALVQRGHPHSAQLARVVESAYLARRTTIHTAADLADLVEKELPAAKAAGLGTRE